MGTEVKAGHNTIGWYVYRSKVNNKGKKAASRDDIVAWCRKFCKGRWAHVPPYTMVYHAFYIEDKNDAMLFKLSWEMDRPVYQKAMGQ